MESIRKQLDSMMNSNKMTERYEEIIRNEVFKDPDVRKFLAENSEILDKEAIERSAAKLYEFVVEKKKAAAQSGELMPGYVPKLLINNKRIDVTYEPSTDLTNRQKQTAINKRIHSMYMPKDIKNFSIDHFESTPGRNEAVERAYDFIDQYLENPDEFQQGLYLYGKFGVGKTFLLGAIAHELSEQGYPSTLVHFPSFAVEMKNSIGQNTTEEKLTVFKKAKILMIDDIGADSMSSWIRDDILGVILQYRMQEQLPTFFSSNFDMAHLENEHFRVTQRGENEPLKAKRIMERIKFLSKEVEMTGDNRRHS
ncbi:primosomal protein DnaI [Marinilactibacillus sp. 15R]|uniref:Primosomal protein DnaI n=1 Tax=Marinilactibacillus piezotolerans TaxID=258723 RepID=A0A1I4AD39_9LACT|nr:primosomal protein DnaI [Marinilactibacillus piezotolerans]API89104.1 primosomal protein DnaI [Marinilactibacillus sp. 15R]SFK54193.1 primosomal protein DnaI [Marinilactibacillus piezotolerans]